MWWPCKFLLDKEQEIQRPWGNNDQPYMVHLWSLSRFEHLPLLNYCNNSLQCKLLSLLSNQKRHNNSLVGKLNNPTVCCFQCVKRKFLMDNEWVGRNQLDNNCL